MHRTTNIVLPKTAKHVPEYITWDSPLYLRVAAERIAKYFHREMKYDFVPFSAHENNCLYKIRLFSDSCYVANAQEMGSQIFGAACFRRRGNTDRPQWNLQWIWLHPFYRNEGVLQNAWPQFLREFGNDFIPEHPYSPAMAKFLIAHLTDEQKLELKKFGDYEKYLFETASNGLVSAPNEYAGSVKHS